MPPPPTRIPQDWREDARTNVDGTINVVEAARRAGVKRFVNFQTALCYGRPERVPIPVEHPLRPFTSYGISKTGRRELSRDERAAVGLAAACQCHAARGSRSARSRHSTSGSRRARAASAPTPCAISSTWRISSRHGSGACATSAPTGIFNVSTGEGHTIKEIFDVVATHLGIALTEPVPRSYPSAPTTCRPSCSIRRTTIDGFGWQAAGRLRGDHSPHAALVRRARRHGDL